MRVLYWISKIILICSIINILFGDKISFAILSTNSRSDVPEDTFYFVAISVLVDALATYILLKLLFSFLFFRFFYLSILKEETYYLKPLIFSLLLNLLTIIDLFPVFGKDRTDDDIFELIYVYIFLHTTAVLIYLSIFLYNLRKNKNQQYRFKWTKEK